jgi:hypothetical protein
LTGSRGTVFAYDGNHGFRACIHRIIRRDREIKRTFTIPTIVRQNSRRSTIDRDPVGFAAHTACKDVPIGVAVVDVGCRDGRVVVWINVHGRLAERNTAFLEFWNGEVEILSVFGFLRRVVCNCAGDVPTILVSRLTLWHFNGDRHGFGFFLVNVDRGFAQCDGEF